MTEPDGVAAFVGMGANVGDRRAALTGAVGGLRRLAVDGAVQVSALYASAAHVLASASPGPDFLNAVATFRTVLRPDGLFAELLRLEAAAGRVRTARWAPRPLDLDLLVYGDAQVYEAGLTVPHPRLAARRFVLAPLADLAPHLAVPGLGATVADLLHACDDAAVAKVAERGWEMG